MAAKLRVVAGDETCAKPSRKLGQHGANLWKSVMAEYQVIDSGGIEMLTAACQQLDRAESLREQIDRDGEIVRTKAGLKEHPALKHELASRAFVVRTLARLGLDVEAVKPIGRPPGWKF
jgi:Phage terminase, small subunit